jgi:hypothetical protein
LYTTSNQAKPYDRKDKGLCYVVIKCVVHVMQDFFYEVSLTFSCISLVSWLYMQVNITKDLLNGIHDSTNGTIVVPHLSIFTYCFLATKLWEKLVCTDLSVTSILTRNA